MKIKLGSKIVDNKTLYFIADIGANHNGSLDKAKELIYLAKEAVKRPLHHVQQ